MKPKRRLTQIFSLMLSSVSLVSIILIGALWISFESNRSDLESRRIRAEYISGHEATISLETNRICNYMEAQHRSSEIKFFKSIKQDAYEAYGLVEAVYNSPAASLAPDRTKEMMLTALRGSSRHRSNNRFYVSTLSGLPLLSQSDLRLENLNIKEAGIGGYAGTKAFTEIAASLVEIKEGFFRYDLFEQQNIENIDNLKAQVVYLKLFEPYGWIIGTGDYLDQWALSIQHEMIDWASGMALPPDTHLLIVNYDGDILSHPDKTKVGKNFFSSDFSAADKKLAATIIRGGKTRNRDIVHNRNIDKNSSQSRDSTIYYRAIPSWRWVVSVWGYTDDLEVVMAERQALLSKNVRAQISRILVISISMLVIIMLLSKVLSALATRSFTAFFKFFECASTSSTEIDPQDQPFEEFARLAMAANNMINQRKLATNLLRESELKFKTIFDVSPQVITISDLGGILMDANEEYQKFSSLDIQAAKGRPLEESFIISEDIRHDLWRELKKGASVVGREINIADREGRQLHFLVFGKMIHMHVSSFILVIFTDITALKDAQNEKLILQEKLARSTKMEAMGLMAAEVAHDLNNILSGIIGYPQLLLMEPNITDRQKETLKEILNTGQRAAAVVSDLLTIARGIASTKASLPINKIVTDYTGSPECKQLQEIFPNVRLKLELSPEAGNIIASPVHLTKVVMNLISNAFEAMPADRADGLIVVKTQNDTLTEELKLHEGAVEPGRYSIISVIDNGPGIPEPDVHKIFEPFYSKKTKGRSGTGLGLAIVWNTIKDHGGYLDIKTGPTGTTFTLYFNTTEEKSANADARRDLKDYMGSGQRVLVVDDVDIQRKLASKMLSTLGYQPVAVPSGEAAVEFLKKEDVDLVILDMIMNPGMNGRETYGAIMEFKPEQKAIIASGMAETEEVARAQAMGAGQFVNKPYTIEDLAAAVKKALA